MKQNQRFHWPSQEQLFREGYLGDGVENLDKAYAESPVVHIG